MVKINTNKLHGNDAVQGAKNERAEKTGGKSPVANQSASFESDTLAVSNRGAEVGKLVDQLKQFPDVRQDRVDELHQKIASGEYDPSADDIADAIIKDEK